MRSVGRLPTMPRALKSVAHCVRDLEVLGRNATESKAASEERETMLGSAADTKRRKLG